MDKILIFGPSFVLFSLLLIYCLHINRKAHMHVHDFFAMGCDKGTIDIDEFPWRGCLLWYMYFAITSLFVMNTDDDTSTYRIGHIKILSLMMQCRSSSYGHCWCSVLLCIRNGCILVVEISCYHFVFVCFHVALFWDHVLTYKELRFLANFCRNDFCWV